MPEANAAVENFAAWLAAAPLPPAPDTPYWPELRERARLNLRQLLHRIAADEQTEAENAQAPGYALG